MAGLEGSGHHFLEALWTKLQGTAGFNVLDAPLPVFWGCQSEWIKKSGYMEMVGTFQSQRKGAVYMLPSQYSYPCGKASHEDRRDRFYPHINWISEAASDTSTDFRVIFLYRPMKEVLAADCLHRRMESSCVLQAETLVQNAAHLTAQIDAVRKEGHHGVQCMVYGDLPEMIGSVEKALGIDLDLDETIREIWRPSDVDDPEVMYPEWWPKVARTLWKADAQLLESCNAGSRISTSENLFETFRFSGPLL